MTMNMGRKMRKILPKGSLIADLGRKYGFLLPEKAISHFAKGDFAARAGAISRFARVSTSLE